MAPWSKKHSFRIGNPNTLGSAFNKIPQAITASGLKVQHGTASALRRLVQPWQIRAFGYYDQLGELKYSAQFYERMLAPLILFAARLDDDDELVPADTDSREDKAAREALRRIQDPGGGRSGLLGMYGRLMFLAGEAYLLVSKDDDGIEQWEMLSTDELRLMDGTYMRYMSPTLPAENYQEAPDDAFEPLTDKDAVAYRLWKRHPRYSALADANLQGVLELCEELLILTRAVRARGRSRMAGSGILFISDSISPAPAEAVGDEDPAADIFLADLTEALTASIADEGTASAVVPLIVRVPDKALGENGKIEDLVYHMQIIDPMQVYPETGLRYECIKRIAIGLDMPAEVLTGMADINHWGAWQVDEQTWKGHGQPLAQGLVDNLTAAYFRPMLREQGIKGWDRYQIAYDATAIINHPDRTKDAKDLFDRGELSGEALRNTAGFQEEDAPSEEERNRFMGIKLRDSSLAVYGVPSLRGNSELEPTAGELESPDGTTTKDGVTAGTVDKKPPEEPDEPTVVPETVVGAVEMSARIIGAADLAVLRAREVAGNRLVSLARKKSDSRAAIAGVKTGDVAATLGRDRVRALGAPSDLELVAGARDLIHDALRMHGITDPDAVDLIGDSVEKHAARTLYDLRPATLPPQLTNRISELAARATGR